MTSEIDFEAAHITRSPCALVSEASPCAKVCSCAAPLGGASSGPFADYDDRESASWLATAIEQCTGGWPQPIRDRVPVNCTVPAVGADRAH